MPLLSRRALLRSATALALLGLDRHLAGVEAPSALPAVGFGPLRRDPAGLLDLPAGFRYVVLSTTGQEMADRLLVPSYCDGMACFTGPNGEWLLVRNHELTPDLSALGPFGPGNGRLDRIDPSRLYDRGSGVTPSLGGCTTLVVDPATMTLTRQFLSLAGTLRNCAGGPTPWGTWITCEEDLALPGKGKKGIIDQAHGFAFEVPVTITPGLVAPLPLTAMGRFRREAVCIEPRSGIVYQTEDQPEGVFYRFIPTVPGALHQGGRLQALTLPGYGSGDTSNWQTQTMPVAATRACGWVDVTDLTEAPARQAAAAGAVRFTRGEGCWFADGAAWFTCTDGGRQRKGQIWRYQPSPNEGTAEEVQQPGQLTLIAEPNDGHAMENIDNLTVAPWGDLICAEDSSGNDLEAGNRIIGVTRDGRCYPLALNALNRSELAGVCFSPDGRWLFANIFHPGCTLAITGPWPG